MRAVTLAAATVLLAAATPALAQAVKDANTIARELGLKPAPALASADTNLGATQDDGKIRPKGATAGIHRRASSSLQVLFVSGSAELTPEGRGQLDQFGLALKGAQASGLHLRIEGHTDTVGDAHTNQMLSQRRADAVVAYLTAQYGIARDTLIPVGMGKADLAVPTPDQTPEPRNRRVLVINQGS
jgi:outer membrane protein OmpA-like peptidoglycan-associated protein